MMTNIRSLMAKLIIRMLVVDRIRGLKATTMKDAKGLENKGIDNLFLTSLISWMDAHQ